MAMSKIDRIDREIEKTRGKITEYQNRLKELEAQRTEQENFEIVNLVRSMCMSRDELMNFLRGGGNDAPPVETAYHEQEDMTDDEIANNTRTEDVSDDVTYLHDFIDGLGMEVPVNW